MKKTCTEEIKNFLLNIHEKYFVELKVSSNLPNSFWQTYSSFSNTSGGHIILGVKEKFPTNEIVGVGNADHILTDLWNQASNQSKVNYRNLDNHDVEQYSIDGKDIIIIHVKELPESLKPIFLNGNIENTYIRTGDGDRKVTQNELKAFLRNANPVQDEMAAEKFTLDDIDMVAVSSYKEKVHYKHPQHGYMDMNNKDFLMEIGGCYIDRNTQEMKIRKGTVLFFGKYSSIKELYPQYHLDYFNRKGNNPRWIDRISDDEPSDYEMNIYNFYTIVAEKLNANLMESFALDENHQLRLPVSNFDESIREGLVNCLAHADYTQGYPSIKIEAYDGWFRFFNPGKMLVTPQQFVIGGDSRPRNEYIMKFFRWLGASERQGKGGSLIFQSAIANEFKTPEIETTIEYTELKIWNIDLMDSYPDLLPDEKSIFRMIMKSKKPLSVKELSATAHITPYRLRRLLGKLTEKNMIQRTGNGPTTKYELMRDSKEKFVQLQMVFNSVKKHLLMD